MNLPLRRRIRTLAGLYRRTVDARPPTRRLAGCAFALGVLVPLLFWQVLPASYRVNEASDYLRYHEPVAHNLVAKGKLVDADGRPAIRYPVGFPLFLAAVFALAAGLGLPQGVVLSAALLLCLGAAAALLFLIARRVWKPWPALFATALWITYPPALWLSKQPNTEIAFLPLLFAAVYFFFRHLEQPGRRWAAPILACGVLLGLALLVRPIALALSVVLALMLACVPTVAPRRRAAGVALLLLGTGLAVLPWQLWIQVKAGGAVFLCTTDSRFAIRDGLTFGVRHLDWRQGVRLPPDVRDLMVDLTAGYDRLDSLGGVAEALREQWRKRPLAVIKLFLIKIVRSWYATDSQRYETLLMLLQGGYLILFLAAGTAAWRGGGRQGRQVTVGALLVLLYFWAMTVAGSNLVRYMVPAIGLLFPLVAGFWGPAAERREAP